MFAIGPLEIAVILIFGLLFIGPKKLPELAKQMGKFFVQMKRVTSDVRHTVDDYMKKAENELLAEERAKVRETLEKALNSDDINVQKQIAQAIDDAVKGEPKPIDVEARESQTAAETQATMSTPHQPSVSDDGHAPRWDTDENEKGPH